MIIRNFLYRIEQWERDNRAKIIKVLAVASAALFVAYLIFAGVERLQRARYERRVNALEQQFRDADAKAKDAEARADAKAKEIDAKQAELQFLEARADAAEKRVSQTRARVVTLKETYENIRYVPMPAGPVSCADACAELAAVGYACR